MRLIATLALVAFSVTACGSTTPPPAPSRSTSECGVTALGHARGLEYCVTASPTPGPTSGWTYSFSFYPTTYATHLGTPTLYSATFPITGPSILMTDPYCLWQAGHDAVADATTLFFAIKNAQGVWGTSANAAQIRNLLGGFQNEATGGFTVGAGLEFIVGALTLLGPGDFALILVGTGLTTYSIYKLAKCEESK